MTWKLKHSVTVYDLGRTHTWFYSRKIRLVSIYTWCENKTNRHRKKRKQKPSKDKW